MSNRSLFEINHDFAGQIQRNPDEFVRLLKIYLSSGDREDAAELQGFGLRFFGIRHHSSGYVIAWGGRHHSEKGDAELSR